MNNLRRPPSSSSITTSGPLPTATATFCATLVDEWCRAGLTHAVVAPGSRSTPLALALAAENRIELHVVLDERSAGFVALGVAISTRTPIVLLTTSGTATAELHAAVIEAHQADVPLIVVTADRPPELRDVGAAQTIDQNRLYGGVVRLYVDPGTPDPAVAHPFWRSLAAQVWITAAGDPRPGPVQLNLPFRDPLVGEADTLPPARTGGRPWHRRVAVQVDASDAALAEVAGMIRPGAAGVLLAGWGVDDPAPLLGLAELLGWPVLADPRGGARTDTPTAVFHADAILRDPALSAQLRPEVVVRFGQPPASKVVGQWLAGATHSVVVGEGAWSDPDRTAELFVPANPSRFAMRLTAHLGAGATDPVDRSWLDRWQRADRVARRVIAAQTAPDRPLSEPAVARAVAAAAEATPGRLVVSSSMPIRDVEWYADAVATPVVANRGANGIDGVISTATGVALCQPPVATTWLLIGDLALLHDGSALVGLAQRSLHLRIVVVDNDGGGIFSFLPQASQLSADRFEQLFGTPQATRPAALLEANGVPVTEISTRRQLDGALAALAASTAAVEALVVRVDRSTNVAAHAAIHRAVADELRSSGAVADELRSSGAVAEAPAGGASSPG